MTTSRLDILGAVRDDLFGRISAASDRDAPSLVRQLTDVLEQIETLEKASAPVKGTPLDELRSRRARRPVAGSAARSAS